MRYSVFALAIVCMLGAMPSSRADFIPPPAKPERIKGGEGVPPLPLPATPLRRTERKHPPAPPALIGKIIWGGTYEITAPDGRKVEVPDWNSDPADLEQLVARANAALGIWYGAREIKLAGFSGDPSEIPVLYANGHRAFKLSPEEKGKLKAYLENGGFLWAQACCGAAEFTAGFQALLAELFPANPLERLPMDHPVFVSGKKIEKTAYGPAVQDRPDGLPCLYGVDLGCRTAVIFSPYDMCCGWDNHSMAGAQAVAIPDSQALGFNMLAYSLAYSRLGRFLSRTKIYYEEGERARGDFTIGQVAYRGNWDPGPSSLANLLKRVVRGSSTKVQFARERVELGSDGAFDFPLAYLTGHGDLRLTPAEGARLKSYLNAGGFLFANACCGRRAFDAAFRREVEAVLGKKLAPLPLDHPVYSTQHKIHEVAYTPLVRDANPDLRIPTLEGIDFDGVTRVIYSRYGLDCGWENEDHPFTRSYEPEDALKIGMNVLVYFMTH